MTKGKIPNTSLGCLGSLGWIIFIAFFAALLAYQNGKRHLPHPPVVPFASSSAVAK